MASILKLYIEAAIREIFEVVSENRWRDWLRKGGGMRIYFWIGILSQEKGIQCIPF